MPTVTGRNVVKKVVIILIMISVMLAGYYLYGRNREIHVWTGESQKFPSYTFDSQNSTLKLVTSQDDAPFLIPPDDVLKQMSEEDLLRVYWKYINTVQTLCRTQTRVGSLLDGGKEMCVDPNYVPRKPCLVYSFGSNFQFDFDLAMHDYYGCEVYTYDPSMNIKTRPTPKQVKFELRGLDGTDYVNEKNWKMSMLETIMKDNGHLNETIDVLKIDVEGSEWKALPPFFESGLHKQVKQILIEIHVGREPLKEPIDPKPLWGQVPVYEQVRVLRLIYEYGFRIFMRERNLGTGYKLHIPPEKRITTVNELSLLNMDYYP